MRARFTHAYVQMVARKIRCCPFVWRGLQDAIFYESWSWFLIKVCECGSNLLLHSLSMGPSLSVCRRHDAEQWLLLVPLLLLVLIFAVVAAVVFTVRSVCLALGRRRCRCRIWCSLVQQRLLLLLLLLLPLLFNAAAVVAAVLAAAATPYR